MPCSRGSAPVMNVACTVQVTAGVTVASGRAVPARASAPSRGCPAEMARRQTHHQQCDHGMHRHHLGELTTTPSVMQLTGCNRTIKLQ